MSRPIIDVSNVGKVYRLGEIGTSSFRDEVAAYWRRWRRKERPGGKQEFWALKEVSFSVQPGEVVGIVGRNGAGKSTLLKILSRITEPTTGRAVLRGRVASLLEVGTGFHPDLSGRDNIYLNGAILGMTRAEIRNKFDEIVAFAEVEQFIDTPVKRYSSGMYVRLAFAVAAHLEPEILIVDEVLAVGDAQFQRKCLAKMDEVAAIGRTVLFVSHNPLAIRSLCSRALLLEHGRVAKIGEPSDVLNAYNGSGAAANAEAVWPDYAKAPGNESVRLHRVGLKLPRPAHPPDIRSPIDIEIAYWNRLDGCEQNVSLLLNTAGGVCVLNTYSAVRKLPAGLVMATCHIPADFLNDETYHLDVLIVKDGSAVLHHETDVLRFSTIESHRDGAWHGKHAGVIRPKLDWTIETSAA